ncbi:hypothetical protein TRFO_21688 [Tritrichomonas foetus]|uniref:Uncharacterized protein n=1 Tax=Tritrichomonas foetus TaxID=1144522 RepID=A0A1J4KDV6_9EUKA|nr:hypothetical protein TRFO_21688 [Tritrichomonas foetus]|eukprot:OHT09379.1 hypothetical protein TRFO_21688 [Tritrichomonas foetus]
MTTEEQYCSCQNICIRGTHATNIRSSNCRSHFKFENTSQNSAIPSIHYKVNKVFQIHTGSILIENYGLIDVQVLGHHHVQITCGGCHTNLVLYASKHGAFCQLQSSFETALCGSLPPTRFFSSFVSQTIPKSMKPLFTTQNPNLDKFTIEPSIPEELTSENAQISPNRISPLGSPKRKEPARREIDNENILLDNIESPQQDTFDPNHDYELMFSSKIDPYVGSYAEVGKFIGIFE